MARRLGLASVAALLLAGSARAADPWEFWPELNAFEGLGPTTRLFFTTSYVRGREADTRTLDVSGYVDVTLKPVFWPALAEGDWQRRKYVWMRVGYGHSFKIDTGQKSTPEDRGVVALLARAYLPAELLLEGRARADLRWIAGDYSTRYRLRAELTRDLGVGATIVTPYIQTEVFYDTRYDGASRYFFQVGTNVTVTQHFHVEPYYARQMDRLPSASGLHAVGLVAQWYH